MRKRYMLLLLAVALASAGITYGITRNTATPSEVEAGHSETEDAHGEESHGLEISGLKTEPAVAGEGWDSVALTGRVTIPPDRLVKISPRIDGKVIAAYGTDGDQVRRGQVLVVISSVALAEARAQYRQARARLTAAQKNYEREAHIAKLGGVSVRPVEEARSESLVSQGELADAKSELAQAKSEVTRQESELAQCKSRLDRAKELYADQIVSKQDLETAEAEYKRDTASVDGAKSKVAQVQARIEKAAAKLDISKQYLAREERIYKGRSLDMRTLQAAKSDIASAQVDLQAAADRIRVLGASPSGSGDTLTITCPMNGRIVSRHTNVGEMASPSDTLYTVADLSRVWVEADAYEKDLSRLRKGQTAEIRVEAYPDKAFTGKIDSISDVLNPESRTAKIRCAVSNSQGLLRGDMFARVNLLTAKRGSTVLIPKVAVLEDAGSKIVFTPCMECPEDVKASTNACGAYDKLVVTLGSTRGSEVEALSGVDPGTLIVTTGAYQLKTALGSGKLEAGCTDH